MKRHFIYTFAALALVLSCNRTEPENSSLGESIRIGATLADAPATKAFINKNDLKGGEGKVNPEVKIYDDLTGFTGTINGTEYTNGDVNYINDTMVWASGVGETATWNFNSGINWRWTRSGVHHFYGWLTKDPEGLTPADLVSGVNFTESTKTLSVPAITFTKDTPQFDFSYSDIVAVDVQNSGFNAANSINLPLKHLFTGLAIEIYNSTTDIAYVKTIEFRNVKTAKSASVSFAGDKSKAVYTAAATQPALAVSWPSEAVVNADYGRTIGAGTPDNPTRFDILGGKVPAEGEYNYYMMWPQSKEEFAAQTVYVEYYISGTAAEGEALEMRTKEISLPTATLLEELEAGHKYVLQLSFKEKTLNLTLKPMPWIMDYMDIDYATSSILADSNKDNDGVLWLYYMEENKWKAGTRDRQISMKNKTPIQGRFYILAPTSGMWQVTTFPADAAKYFIIAQKDEHDNYVPSNSGVIDDLIDSDGVFTGYVEFYVLPNPEYPELPATQYLNFNIDFLINGEWRNGNTEFNRKNWTITREPGN